MMSALPSANQPNQPPNPQAKESQKLGGLFVLLFGLVLIVALALVLGWRRDSQVIPNPSTELIIVQLNDIYRLDAVRAGKRGGLARVVSLLRQLKAQNPQVPVIVLHAGDFLSPSLESSVFHGAQMIDAMNFINEVAPLYVVPGNHEFDYSETDKNYLSEAILKSKFQWIVSNIERSDPAILETLRDKTRAHIVIPSGNVKVGVFGLTIDGAQGGEDRSYGPISGDYARIAGTEIQQLEDEDADVVVGLTHLNIGDDHELAKLKQQHPRFLWIAGGHEHTLNREPSSTQTALITKGDSNARTVWKISIVKNGPNYDVHEDSVVIDDSIPADPEFTTNIEDFYRTKLRENRPYLDTVISAIPDRCYDGTEEAVRDRESDWGDLLADTMRKAFKRVSANVAVLNGGSIRIDDTICGRITFENLERTFAYETPVVLVKIKGADLKKFILEDSANSKRGDGRFLQVSGVTFRRDFSATGSDRLKDLQVQSGRRSTSFVDKKTYVVAVNKYIFDCGDGYKFRQSVTDYIPAGADLRALTYAALAAQGKRKKSKQPAAGRIVDLPAYVKLPSLPAPKWQTLSPSDRQCR
jgi:5'-nucleotidase